jgi:signal peptidase I
LRGDAGYAEAVTETTDSPEGQPDSEPADPEVAKTPPSVPEPVEVDAEEPHSTKRAALRETGLLGVIALGLYFIMLHFVARPYLIPSESMEPTLHGCSGCVGDRIMVDKLTFHFSTPHPGDVIVFKGPPAWNVGYKSIRSHDAAIRGLQNTLSVIGFVPPDENDLVKRVIAVGGQTVQCRNTTGLTVNGVRLKEPYLDPATLNADPSVYPCLGPEFGPINVPQGRLWMMGDNRTHSADSRAHCTSTPGDAMNGLLCTGDPTAGTVPVSNVIGKARFIVWPPGRWGSVRSVNPQQNH